jgi:putative membrane-bound dehydrogenase-like protein
MPDFVALLDLVFQRNMLGRVRFGVLTLFLSCALPAVGSGTATNAPMPLAEVAGHVTAPPGFHATLFAGEPDVRQPIAMAFDDRGRLWVVECYTYDGIGENGFNTNLRDRILIFEDSKGTGHFDKRKVFWDQGVRLTGIALGFGGVFCTSAPNLIFIPDRNGGDIPDGPPQILLDGWNADQIHHNIVNGLKWGPDGWLYGRQGIMATSAVGKPGTPEEARTRLNCAIWRYHPTRKIFEVVCQGGTNPWGHDWDQYGELFFINTVIGHLWHGIPGAFYKRMYGEHLAPYRYGLIDQTADHYHWNTGKSWTASRNGAAGADALGGGHAHSGLMIYLADNWPEEYYGDLFMLNFFGRRINQDVLERRGSGYVGRHGADLVRFGDPWFQGVDLDYGPDGGVSVLDWSDTGECHGYDGVHRETGRIYKLTYEGTNRVSLGEGPAPLSLFTNSLANLSDAELLRLQLHPNEWYARHARRILQERAPSLPASFRAQVLSLYDAQTRIAMKLRLLFTLHAVGGDSRDWLKAQLKDSDEHVRSWAVRWLGEAPEVDWDELVPLLVGLAATDPSPAVRLYLASALQRMPKTLREPLAAALLQHAEDASDHNLPLMLWYGIEPMVAQYPENAIRLAMQSRIPLVRQYISRRLGEEISKDPKSMDNLLAAAGSAGEAAQCDILHGLADALQGWHAVPKPGAWDSLRAGLEKSANRELLGLARQAGAVFGDPWALHQLAQIALDTAAPADDRRAALRQVIDARPANLPKVLEQSLKDRVTAGIAAHGLLLLGDPNIAAWALQQWNNIAPDDRAVLVGLMVSRASSAALLLDAVAHGVVPRSALNAFHARQIGNFNDPALSARLTQVWGEVHSSAADKLQLIARYRSLLTPERLKQAELSRGREVFSRTCAVCHKLYGEGASIGPDLTGGGRANLNYLLENITDPSAIVPADYRVSEVELKDGRDLTALVVAKTDHSLTLQTPTERFTVERGEVINIHQTTISLMPEGLLQGMKDEEICNLIAYLMAPNQVPLPPAAKK